MSISFWSGVPKTFLLVLLVCVTAAGVAEQLPLAGHLTYERFQAYTGEQFRVWGGDGLRRVIKLKLDRIDASQVNAQVEQFTLHFSGPLDYKLEKNTYKFEHPQSGLFRLWLEPATAEGNQQWYRVEFNQLK